MVARDRTIVTKIIYNINMMESKLEKSLSILVTEDLPRDLRLSVVDLDPNIEEILISEEFINRYYGYFIIIPSERKSIYLSIGKNDTFSFECLRCGDCCRSPPFPHKKEIEEIKSLNPEYGELFEEVEVGETGLVREKIKIREGYCAFFNKEKKACEIYPHRPFICRARPLVEVKELYAGLDVAEAINVNPSLLREAYQKSRKLMEEQDSYKVSICKGILKGEEYTPKKFIREGGYYEKLEELFLTRE